MLLAVPEEPPAETISARRSNENGPGLDNPVLSKLADHGYPDTGLKVFPLAYREFPDHGLIVDGCLECSLG